MKPAKPQPGKPSLAPAAQISVDGLVVEVVRKKVKTVRLTVYPPDGRVRLSAPLRMSDQAVEEAVRSGLGWIRRQQARIAAQAPTPSPRYLSGERHDVLGERCVLNVVEQEGRRNVVVRRGATLDLLVREGSDAAQRERVLLEWYRGELQAALPPLIAKWEAVLGVRVAEWRVRRMKTRWGSCNVKARRIWLNLELSRRPVRCLEYVVVHEMVHLLARKHDAAFRAHMDRALPNWRQVREELRR